MYFMVSRSFEIFSKCHRPPIPGRSHSCPESFPGSGWRARRRGPTSWCSRPWLTWRTWRCPSPWRRRRHSSTRRTSAGLKTTTSATTPPCLKSKWQRLEKSKVTIRDDLSQFSQKVFLPFTSLLSFPMPPKTKSWLSFGLPWVSTVECDINY